MYIHCIINNEEVLEAIKAFSVVKKVTSDKSFDTAVHWSEKKLEITPDIIFCEEFAYNSRLDPESGELNKDKVILESLKKLRFNLPTSRIVLLLQQSKKSKVHEKFLSHLVSLGIYDFHFVESFAIDDLKGFLFNTPRTLKDVSSYVLDFSVVPGNDNQESTTDQSIFNHDNNNEETGRSNNLFSPTNNKNITKIFAAKIIVVSGVKGGVGKTDISINLATAFKKHISNARICLLDFDFPYGGVSRALGILPDCHLGDWLSESKPLTEKGVKSRVTCYEELDIIPMALNLKDCLKFQEKQAQTMLDTLRRYYDIVIVDTSSFTEPALVALTISSEIIYVCTHDIVSISSTHAYKEDLINLYGVNPDKMSLFINMCPEYEDLSKEQIAVTFEDTETGIPIIGYAPYDDVVRQYRNKQSFIYDHLPGHSFAIGINMILQSMGIETGTYVNPVDNIKAKLGGVLGMLKKSQE